MVFSGLSPLDDRLPVSFNQLHYNEQILVGAYGCSYRHGHQALSFIADGRVAVEDMISHRMPLDDLAAALELVENRRRHEDTCFTPLKHGRNEYDLDQ